MGVEGSQEKSPLHKFKPGLGSSLKIPAYVHRGSGSFLYPGCSPLAVLQSFTKSKRLKTFVIECNLETVTSYDLSDGF